MPRSVPECHAQKKCRRIGQSPVVLERESTGTRSSEATRSCKVAGNDETEAQMSCCLRHKSAGRSLPVLDTQSVLGRRMLWATSQTARGIMRPPARYLSHPDIPSARLHVNWPCEFFRILSIVKTLIAGTKSFLHNIGNGGTICGHCIDICPVEVDCLAQFLHFNASIRTAWERNNTDMRKQLVCPKTSID